jgi:hypothetical protein
LGSLTLTSRGSSSSLLWLFRLNIASPRFIDERTPLIELRLTDARSAPALKETPTRFSLRDPSLMSAFPFVSLERGSSASEGA